MIDRLGVEQQDDIEFEQTFCAMRPTADDVTIVGSEVFNVAMKKTEDGEIRMKLHSSFPEALKMIRVRGIALSVGLDYPDVGQGYMREFGFAAVVSFHLVFRLCFRRQTLKSMMLR